MLINIEKNSDEPWPGIIKLFPTRENLVSDIPAGDGKMANLFLQCISLIETKERKKEVPLLNHRN
jgi:hypothetical protein